VCCFDGSRTLAGRTSALPFRGLRRDLQTPSCTCSSCLGSDGLGRCREECDSHSTCSVAGRQDLPRLEASRGGLERVSRLPANDAVGNGTGEGAPPPIREARGDRHPAVDCVYPEAAFWHAGKGGRLADVTQPPVSHLRVDQNRGHGPRRPGSQTPEKRPRGRHQRR
jgi:hypothetical protein